MNNSDTPWINHNTSPDLHTEKDTFVGINTARAAEQNPDLPLHFIHEVADAEREIQRNMITRYQRRTSKTAISS